LKLRTRIVATSVLLGVLLPAPAFAVSKEIIQMQQQLDTLQQAVANLQRTVDTQTAILKTLLEQANDNVNGMKSTVAALKTTNSENLANTNTRFDSMSSQIQALGESLDEAKARLSKLSEQLAQTQNVIQTLSAQSAAAQQAQPGAAPTNASPGPGAPNASSAAPPAPDPGSLYNAGLRDYSAGRYDLAIQEFRQYVQSYGQTDLASNAQFYIGDAYYNERDYKKAIEEYNTCLERYPRGNKLAAAQLKKAYALIELGRTHDGAVELRSLIRRFPGTHEADLARQRLRRLS
jgi:tol-pal system protein YbgF